MAYGPSNEYIHYGKEDGNALTIDWEDVISEEELSYIIGNPQLLNTFGNKTKGIGKLDYVTAWYYKAAQYM